MINIETTLASEKLVVEKTGLFVYSVGPRVRLKVAEGADFVRIKGIDHGLFETQDIWDSDHYNTREFLVKNQNFIAALANHLRCPVIKVGQTVFNVILQGT